MAVSVEAYLLTNFGMNFLATAIIARSLGRVRWQRVLCASALGAMWAALAQLAPLRFLASPLSAAVLPFLLASVAIPPESLRSALQAGLALLGGSVFLGGVQLAALRLFDNAGAAAFLTGAFLGAGALMAATSLRKKRLVTWEVQVFLAAAGGEARFRALIDTGNRLREPFSGLPVLICERGVLSDVLPAGYDALPPGDAPPGFRQIGYGALGGGGTVELLPTGIVSGGLWQRLSQIARPLGGGLSRENAGQRAGAGPAGGRRGGACREKGMRKANDGMKGA